jgi:hypothetical protein
MSPHVGEAFVELKDAREPRAQRRRDLGRFAEPAAGAGPEQDRAFREGRSGILDEHRVG